MMKPAQYTIAELRQRIEEMNKGGLVLSTQYGMVFILNQKNEILLKLNGIVDEKDLKGK